MDQQKPRTALKVLVPRQEESMLKPKHSEHSTPKQSMAHGRLQVAAAAPDNTATIESILHWHTLSCKGAYSAKLAVIRDFVLELQPQSK